MPLVDKLERIGVLLQNGLLSPREYHQAKAQLLPYRPAEAQRQKLRQELAHAEQVFRCVRHHCLVSDGQAGYREPRWTYLYGLGTLALLWVTLGMLVITGFRGLLPFLTVFPCATFLIGLLFIVRSMFTHAHKITRLAAAQRQWERRYQELHQQLKKLGA